MYPSFNGAAMPPASAAPSAPGKIFRTKSATLKHLSLYASLAGIPLLLNPKYRVDDFSTNGEEFLAAKEALEVRFSFDFEKEKAVLNASNIRTQAAQAALKSQTEQANRFRGTEAILTPEPAANGNNGNTSSENQPRRTVDIREFENGMPPPDPWEVPRNVNEELQDVLHPPPNPARPASPSRPQPGGFSYAKPTSSQQLGVGAGAGAGAGARLPGTGMPPPGGVPMFGGVGGAPANLPPKPVSSLLIPFVARLLNSSGLSKEAIVKGYQHLGEDEKKVLIFAGQYDRLIQCGFDPELVVTAVLVYENNNAEAVEFIQNFAELKTMGFPDERIKEALIKHKNNKTEALNKSLLD